MKSRPIFFFFDHLFRSDVCDNIEQNIFLDVFLPSIWAPGKMLIMYNICKHQGCKYMYMQKPNIQYTQFINTCGATELDDVVFQSHFSQ